MSNESDQGLSRRRAIAAGIAGAAGLAAGAAIMGGGEPQAGTGDGPAQSRTQRGQRMPVVYLPHGGGPWPFVDLGLDRGEMDRLLAYLRSLRTLPATAPRALLVISAHWEERVPTVMTAERPPMLYDYRGFPPASYEITWPAPGDPTLAARVRELLGQAGFETAADGARGYDHGTFVPLKVAYPEADIPAVQLSLLRSLDPGEHLRMGRALAPLRDEGVLILGSGMSFHNLRAFRDQRVRPAADAFDAWLRETALLEWQERDRRLAEWAQAPSARTVHPREEHLLPLMVVAGAAGEDRGTIPYSESYMGMPITAVHFA
jgi:aromatic ring-opening dioxygenase catalytic subunit (LigB family)